MPCLLLLLLVLLQSGEYVINLCMWHRKMLPQQHKDGQQQQGQGQDQAGGSLGDELKKRWKGLFKGSS
jgi:hypothetical protein